jgi:DNA-binding NtrC family response regulator
LDEVDTLSALNQVKLLRFIQEKEYRLLGDRTVRRANVRFIAATNADLEAAVDEGRFRADLFFRLRVVPVKVPPLCERRDDIAPLCAEYICRYADEYATAPIVLSDGARDALQHYSWPGNIRELENCIRYLTCLGLNRTVDVADLPLLPKARGSSSRVLRLFQYEKNQTVDRFEREYLEEALRQADGNIARAARSSGKARRAFFELLRKHEIDATQFRRAR